MLTTLKILAIAMLCLCFLPCYHEKVTSSILTYLFSYSSLTMKFNTDGTLNYTFNGLIQNVTWDFEFDETVIKIIGLEFDSIGSVSDEWNSQVYQLDELNLIYQTKTVDNPDQLTFDIYRK